MGQYSIRSCYKIIIFEGRMQDEARIIWGIVAPQKINAFLWPVSKEATLTKDKLQKRG